MQQVRQEVRHAQTAHSPAVPLARPSSPLLAASLPEIDFSTLVGPRSALETAVTLWSRLIDTATLRQVDTPRILPLSPAAQAAPDVVLRVAIINHPARLGAALIRRLRDQLPRLGLVGVSADRGYFLGPATMGVNAPAERWTVTWTAKHASELRRPVNVSLPSTALGSSFVAGWPPKRTIVLVDSGDEGADSQIGFELYNSDYENPVDAKGHGTSVGSLIRLVAPGAGLQSFRVLQNGESLVQSGLLLQALTEALHPAHGSHVVCIPLRALISVNERGHQATLERILHQHAGSQYPTPVVVCAAGNQGRRQPMRFPATVRGVLIARGLTWSGEIAKYNCSPPPGPAPYTVDAFGGVEGDPIGTRARPRQPEKGFYGSSFAAALVTGAVARISL
jgi:Subtilase family